MPQPNANRPIHKHAQDQDGSERRNRSGYAEVRGDLNKFAYQPSQARANGGVASTTGDANEHKDHWVRLGIDEALFQVAK